MTFVLAQFIQSVRSEGMRNFRIAKDNRCGSVQWDNQEKKNLSCQVSNFSLMGKKSNYAMLSFVTMRTSKTKISNMLIFIRLWFSCNLDKAFWP